MDIDAAADRLEWARDAHVGLRPLSQEFPELTEQAAWAVAAEVDRRLVQRGNRRSGYKLGWTSSAMREALGIDKPNYGSLWEDMAVDRTLHLSTLRHPKAEPEFAFRADRALSGHEVDAEDVRRAGRWAVSLEVVDPRWETYEFTWLDNTADGSSAAAYVTGPFAEVEAPPEELTLTMTWNGDSRSGAGHAAMGSPADAVAYLVRELADRGTGLEPGMIVLTGGITAPVDLRPGLRVTVTSPQIGSCSVVCE